MAIEELPGVRAHTARAGRSRWLIAGTGAAWALVGTMHYWWDWLWTRLGLLSVPVDMLVWIVAIILTILLAPVLWHRFHNAWAVVFVVGALCLGGTATVLSPWHDVLGKAWMATECGSSDCSAPQSPQEYSWRPTGP